MHSDDMTAHVATVLESITYLMLGGSLMTG